MEDQLWGETSALSNDVSLLSAKAKGKRKAGTGAGSGRSKAAPKAKARKARSTSVATTGSVDDDEGSVKPKGKRDKKPLKKAASKSIVRPALPPLFQIEEPNERELEEQKKELQRGMDP